MNGWFNPDSWLDIVDHVLLIVGALSMAIVPTWFAARNNRTLKAVKDQVVNGHKSPMRSDLDLVLTRLEDVSSRVDGIARDVSGLRSELAEEENRRRDNVRELHNDMSRNRSDLRDGISDMSRRLEILERDITGDK